MDQHPIPQDVTGFQFKLIGSMTVKQFGYVAGGVIVAVVIYYLPLKTPFAFLIKSLLIPLFGASGVITAFIPIEGRPIDVMTTIFIKALFSPNQYIYHKMGRKLSFTSFSYVTPQQKTTSPNAHHNTKQGNINKKEQQLQALLLNSSGKAKNELDKKELAYLNTFSVATATPPSTALPTPAAVQAPMIPQIKQMPMKNVEGNTKEALAQKELILEHQLVVAKQQASTSQGAHQITDQIEKQIQEIHSQKQQLEQELSRLKNTLSVHQGAQPTTQPAPQQNPQFVRNIAQGANKAAGLPHISDTPNVIAGIVKDSRDNVLPNILVEVKDKDGNPVRAFKTNLLGQFTSATPLTAGTYTIQLEDPKKQHVFDIVQITASNQIMLPIEIISHDAREDLRKSLFN